MPYASASFHNITTIHASSTRTNGAPLTLTLLADDGIDNAHVTIFLADQALVDRLIEAINRVTDHTAPIEEVTVVSEHGPLGPPHPDDYRD